MLLSCQVYVYTVCSLIYATFYFKVLQIINFQNINSSSGSICGVFEWSEKWNFQESRIALYHSMSLRTNNCAIISLESLTVMNINLNGDIGHSFLMVSKNCSSKSSENSP